MRRARVIVYAAVEAVVILVAVVLVFVWPHHGDDQPAHPPQATPVQMRFDDSGGGLLEALERVARPGRVRIARMRRGDGWWTCIMVDGAGRHYELDAGLQAQDFPGLAADGFSPAPPNVSKAMSIYRSVARSKTDHNAARADRITVLSCPKEQWSELRLAWPAVEE